MRDGAGTRMTAAAMVQVLPWAGGTVAGLLTFLLGWDRSLWFDEGYTVMVERLPLDDMMRWLAVDAHPPLYYLLLRAWMAVFGDSFAAMRALSAVCCGLTVVATAALVRCVSDKRHMVLALPVLIIGPLALRYGYEIRMYALLMLLAALGTLILFHAMRAEAALARVPDTASRWRVRAWWALYAAVVCFGMLTQCVRCTPGGVAERRHGGGSPLTRSPSRSTCRGCLMRSTSLATTCCLVLGDCSDRDGSSSS